MTYSLKIRIHDLKTWPNKNVIWSAKLDGKNAKKEHERLKALSNDTLLQGEMIALRFNDGDGGGFAGSGALLDIELEVESEQSTVVDVYLSLDKWRSW